MRLRIVTLLALVASAAVSVVAAGPPADAAGPRPVWRRELPSTPVRESSPALVDLDHDGRLDVVFGGHDQKVWALRGSDGGTVARWPQPVTNKIDSSPAVADVDGDGFPELFVGTGTHEADQGAMYSFDDDGRVRFRFEARDRTFPRPAIHATPAIGDVTGDGGLDVSFGSLGLESIWTVDAAGAPVMNFYADDTAFSSPALADLDGDGRLDVVIGTDSTPGPPVDHRGGVVRAISGTGRQLWEVRLDDTVRSSPSVGDVDGDGKLEVVVGAGDYYGGSDSVKVTVIAADGAVRWKRALDGVPQASPALADLDGDGRLDIAVGTFDSMHGKGAGGSVYGLRGSDGADLAGFPVKAFGGVVVGSVVTADVDGDGGQDVFAATGAGAAVYSGKTGRELLRFGEGEAVSFQNSPAIADVDGDGVLDVVLVGTRSDGIGVAYRYALPSTARLGALGWHQFRKDGRRTGSWTSTVPDAATIPFARVAGSNRFATAVALSAGAPAGATVYVATARSSGDALAGGPAAAAAGGRVLLTERDQLPAETRARLAELRPGRIVVLGGVAAVDGDVFAELDSLATDGATRVGGDTRYDTAAAISAGAFEPGVPVAYVATGSGFADALAGGAAAARDKGPVLLVERDRIPGATAAELARLKPRTVVVLGSTGVVSAGVESALTPYAPSVARAGGGDRYATAVDVARRSFPNGAATAYVATGLDFPDGLAAAPMVAAAGAPLLLVPGRCVPVAVRAELTRLGATRVVLVGGESVVSSTIGALNPC